MSNQIHRLAVGIATRGRPAILCETLTVMQTQQRQPDLIVVAYTQLADIGDAPLRFPDVRFLESAPGLTTQRNRILDEVGGYDLIAFFDDDFWLDPSYLATITRVMCENPDVVIATGELLADGINGPGLSLEQAHALLATADVTESAPTLHTVFNGYGCNMTIRLHPIRTHKLRFDEQLPLYGWYEDVDFSRQLAPFGRIVHVDQACGVHLGAKSGRNSGRKLGYSQVANPLYLARKGTVGWTFAVASILSRSLKNLVFSVRPEPLIDRRGRLIGNVHAWFDLSRGSLHPIRILAL